jgi:hypothetical protein
MATMHEAEMFFKAAGAVRSAEAGVVHRTYGGAVSWSPMFVHFFNENGGEVGYVTLDLLTMQGYTLKTFETPRLWHPMFTADLRAWRAL